MKRLISAFIIIIISFVLQATVCQWISFGGIIPNVILIVTACYGFMVGEKYGLVIGFFCGLLSDVFFGTFIGLNALFFMYIGFFNGKFHQMFYKDSIKLPLIMITVSDFMYGISYYVIMFMLRSRFDFSFYFIKTILPEVIYTVLISVLVYPLLLLQHNYLTKDEEKDGMRFV